MPAKKNAKPAKKAKVTWAPWTPSEEAAGLRSALEEEQRISKGFLAKIQEDAEVIRGLQQEVAAERAKLASAQARDDEHLTAIRELVDAKNKDRAADQAEIEYWMGEVNRLHYELIDMQREAARDEVR